ncbi:MAG: heavy metal translocating P-type ATPase [Oscillospiraceae bacterium]
MDTAQKRLIYRILAASLFFIAEIAAPLNGTARLLFSLIPYLIVGWDVLYYAVGGIFRGRLLDENFLMAVATIGAFAIGKYTEGVAVMLFYQIGELFQNVAVSRSRRSITALMDISPDYANVLRNGEVSRVSPEAVSVGETIRIKPGEKIPLDGIVTKGSSAVDTRALTGESIPREVTEGGEVISGCINMTGVLEVRVSKSFEDSTVSKILELVETSAANKAKSEAFITRFARYYTPIVVACAAVLAIVPPLFVGDWPSWINRALIFLVVSCPCALVISVPLSFFAGIGGASKHGILVKGAVYLESLAKTETVVFDKTGTLTEGSFAVTAVHPEPGTDKDKLITLAAAAESFSNHPLSKALHSAAGKTALPPAENVHEVAGRGVTAVIGGKTVAAGSHRLMEEIGADNRPCKNVGTIVHVAENSQYLGHIVVSDEIKPGAAKAIAALKALGITKTVMLTGDLEAVGRKVASELALDEVHTQLLPDDKVKIVETLLSGPHRHGALAFVGDGVNDAPALVRADTGIAMGAFGSDAAIEAADVVLMDDDPEKIPLAIAIAKKTVAIVRQNILFALSIKAAVLILGAFGLAEMWEAVFADVGVSVIAILNAARAYKS